MADNSKVRATVTAVDLKRGVCKCVTPSGSRINDVRWLSLQTNSNGGASDGYHPQELDTVFIEKINGVNYIIGSEHVAYYKVTNTRHIRTQAETPEDVADYSTMSFQHVVFSPGQVEDAKVGDKIQTVDTGSMFGMRRSGTFIAKVNSLCQMMLSPFGDLFRLVVRNHEVFTDVESTYKVNSRGKLYTLRNIFRSPEDSKNERATIVELEGDVAQGEVLGKGYAGLKKDEHSSTSGGASAEDVDAIRKVTMYDKENLPTYVRTHFLDGKVHETVTKSGGESKVEIHSEGNTHWVRVHNGDGSFMSMDETKVHLDVGNASTIDIDKDKIVINASGGSTATINKDGTVVVKASSSTTIDSPVTNIKGKLNVDGATTLKNTLDVTGASSLKATLNVTGFSQLSGGVNVG